MTKEEYKEAQKKIELEAYKKQRDIDFKYAMSINTYSKGDKVTDKVGTILIDKIVVGLPLDGMPCCVYYGIELNKNGKPRKNRREREVYGCNVIKPNK